VLSSTASSIAKPTPGISNSGPLTSSVLASFLQVRNFGVFYALFLGSASSRKNESYVSGLFLKI
jgi:hypothetical protein